MERFQKEFQEAMAAGELKEEIFTENEWQLIQILVRNAEAYVYAEQNHRLRIEKNREISRLKKELREVKNSTTSRWTGHYVPALRAEGTAEKE